MAEEFVTKERLIEETRKGSFQFAKLYFYQVKYLYENFGHDRAKEMVRQYLFEFGIDRSNHIREAAIAANSPTETKADFAKFRDFPFCAWVKEMGKDHCPYAQCWRSYFEEYPWFQEFAAYYCDVMDTTTIENFSKHLTHRITQNVVLEGESCERVYFESERVKEGNYTYATFENQQYNLETEKIPT